MENQLRHQSLVVRPSSKDYAHLNSRAGLEASKEDLHRWVTALVKGGAKHQATQQRDERAPTLLGGSSGRTEGDRKRNSARKGNAQEDALRRPAMPETCMHHQTILLRCISGPQRVD